MGVMEIPVSADAVRQLLVSLDGGDLLLSESGGEHVEGTAGDLTEVVHHGNLLKIRARGSSDVRLAIPRGLNLKARTRGGDVFIQVALGAARIAAQSGDIRLESVTGPADLSSDSGDIDVASAGNTQARSGSGDVTVGSAHGQLQVRTGSGDITVGTNRGQAWLESGSGDVSLGVPEDLPTLLDLRSATGSVAVSTPQRDRPESGGDHARVHAATSSGDIRITRA